MRTVFRYLVTTGATLALAAPAAAQTRLISLGAAGQRGARHVLLVEEQSVQHRDTGKPLFDYRSIYEGTDTATPAHSRVLIEIDCAGRRYRHLFIAHAPTMTARTEFVRGIDTASYPIPASVPTLQRLHAFACGGVDASKLPRLADRAPQALLQAVLAAPDPMGASLVTDTRPAPPIGAAPAGSADWRLVETIRGASGPGLFLVNAGAVVPLGGSRRQVDVATVFERPVQIGGNLVAMLEHRYMVDCAAKTQALRRSIAHGITGPLLTTASNAAPQALQPSSLGTAVDAACVGTTAGFRRLGADPIAASLPIFLERRSGSAGATQPLAPRAPTTASGADWRFIGRSGTGAEERAIYADAGWQRGQAGVTRELRLANVFKEPARAGTLQIAAVVERYRVDCTAQTQNRIEVNVHDIAGRLADQRPRTDPTTTIIGRTGNQIAAQMVCHGSLDRVQQAAGVLPLEDARRRFAAP